MPPRLAGDVHLPGSRVSARPFARYVHTRPGTPRGDQRRSTFLKSYAKAILACDFVLAFTAAFRMLYVFVVFEHGTRCLARVNVAQHLDASPKALGVRVLKSSPRCPTANSVCERVIGTSQLANSDI